MKLPYFFGIRTKFVLTAALIVALFSFVWGINVISEEKNHLFNKLEDDGKLLMTSVKAPIINTMILQGMEMLPGVLDNYVEEIVRNRELPTVYAYITDSDGMVLAHNRYEEFGKIYKDPLTQATLAGDGYKKSIVHTGTGNILDTAMPLRVAGKSWGVLRIGLSMTPVENEFLKFKMRVLMFSALIFLAGTLVFYIIGYTMSRPLDRLSHAMSNINLGAFEATSLTPRRDEIGILQNSFYNMLSRLQKSEQERQRALNQLIQHEKMATIGKIVAGVAHEINNPLAAISTCIYKLNANIPKGLENCVDIMNIGTQRIQGIVLQLSDFSRTCSLELQHVTCEVFFREITDFIKMALQRSDVYITATDNCRPTVLYIDKGKLHQVILNLIVNAADASPPHGSIEFTAYLQGAEYCLAVKDHGSGIPPESIERIFEIFYTTKPAGEGTGIGLATCKSIVELHKGTIEVASRPGETLFTVRIPTESESGSESS